MNVDPLGLSDDARIHSNVSDCKVLVVVGHDTQVESFIEDLSNQDGFERIPIGCIACALERAAVDGPDINESISQKHGNRPIRNFPKLPRDWRRPSEISHLALGMGEYKRPDWISTKDWAANKAKQRAWTVENIMKVSIREALQLCRERSCDSIEVRIQFLEQDTYSRGDMREELVSYDISWPFSKGNFIKKGRGYSLVIPCSKRSHYMSLFGFEEEETSDANPCQLTTDH